MSAVSPAALPAGTRYTVQPHGNGFAIYRGRDHAHHGMNLGSLTECSPDLAQLLERALNALDEQEARNVLGVMAPEMRYHAPPADRSDPAWKDWTLHDCPDGGRCRSSKGGGCERGWCAHYGVSPDPEGVPRFPALAEVLLSLEDVQAPASASGQPAERTLPGGWTLRRLDDEILVVGPNGGGWWKRAGTLQQRTLFDLAAALLDHAPTPVGWLLRFNAPDPQYEFELGVECPTGWLGRAIALTPLAGADGDADGWLPSHDVQDGSAATEGATR